ncbi:hypothetical protein THASP1DRAFT_31316 [Thamnocephalis sphaerospora]|uniref:Nucleolar protein 12 n=1 Tax=Thamnocephalis sphaerospora TaxID=78915 RepID=A0A4V1IWA4_9FUNG|nr:hypothetical protein THASP1DRAFT_31316 [Thamnocephalis sphaerospora]|eukprot:RKP06869.1 hypothetical protein THASP1DRAFT_31316 [Thamnocephalis sphaerospora]
MASYIPGQLSSLFLGGASQETKPAAPVAKASAKAAKHDGKDATVSSSLEQLFASSVKAQPRAPVPVAIRVPAPTPTPVAVPSPAKPTAMPMATKVSKSSPRKHAGQDKTPKVRRSKRAAEAEAEERFEKVVRERAAAAVAEEEQQQQQHASKANAASAADSDQEMEDVAQEKVESKLQRPKKKDKVQHASRDDDPERLERTVFVGNLPVTALQKAEQRQLRKHFGEYGAIESIRFRSIAFSRPLARKIAFVSGQLHQERDTLNAYIVYKETATVDAALAANGQLFLGHHLRVDRASSADQFDRKRSVFVGNLSFDVQEEPIWRHFANCGEVVNVRVVRDRKTNVGKGFAYVAFADKAAVGLALQMNGSKLENRAIRVSRCLDMRHAKHKETVNAEKKRAFEGERAVKGATALKLQSKRKKDRTAKSGGAAGKKKKQPQSSAGRK